MKVKTNLLFGGALITGIGIGILMGANNSPQNSYVIGGIFAAIGIILLIVQRFSR